MRLFDEINKYTKSDIYPFHMPGHKRRVTDGFPMPCIGGDVTEIEGFDNLHKPSGILKEAQERAARLYGSDKTYFLVNGSTCGILAAISAAIPAGGKILINRNAHISAYHAIELRGLTPVYVYPPIISRLGIAMSLPPESIEEMLNKHTDIDAVFITTPTYEGMVSDVSKIVQIVHEKGLPLIVDEAHGAHLILNEGEPKSAVTLGADIVVNSLHKTLPSPTQTALLHLNGDIVDIGNVEKFLRIYQSSSPSYVLMSGIDMCIAVMEEKGKELFGEFAERRDRFYDNCINKLHNLKIISFESCKILVYTGNTEISGGQLSDMLREKYKLQSEMAAENYVLFIVTIMDSDEGFKRLSDALIEIDANLNSENAGSEIIWRTEQTEPAQMAMKPSDAALLPKNNKPLSERIGEVSTEYICPYPPGIPLTVPGEIVKTHTKGN